MSDANYESGDDYVVQFLGYRFAFNAEDFEERVIGAAVKLRLVESNDLDEEEAADLVELTADQRIEEPRSGSAATSSVTGRPSRPLTASRSSTGCGSWSSAALGSTSA